MAFPLPSPPCNVVPLFELPIERFHSRGHHLCKFIGTKESICKRKLPGDWFGTPTWPPFHCFGTPMWPP